MKAAVEVEAIEPTDKDIVVIIRDGLAYLKSPAHEGHALVEPDYIVALGMSIAFNDRQFRNMMNALVDQQIAMGHLTDIVAHAPTRIN